MAKLTKPHHIAKGIALRAQGNSYRAMGDELSVDKNTAKDFCARHREAINSLALKLISDSIDPIRQNHRDCLALAHEIYQILRNKRKPQQIANVMEQLRAMGLDPKDILTLADKKEHRMLQIMGITPAHTPSTVVNMLFAGKDSQDSYEELASVKGYLEYKRNQDVEEAEFEEIDTTSGQGDGA